MLTSSDQLLCLSGTVFFLAVFALLAFCRYLRYKETLALAEKGLMQPEGSHADGRNTLRWGIVITAVGLALSIGALSFGNVTRVGAAPGVPFGPWMLIGLLPTFFGLALVLVHVLTREDGPRSER